MAALTDLTTVKTFLGIANARQDAFLNQAISFTGALIEELCSRVFGLSNYTEYHSGDATPTLLLDQRPVNSIAHLYVDQAGCFGQASGAFASTTELVQGVDWVLKSPRSGILIRLNTCWPAGLRSVGGLICPVLDKQLGNIKVVYNAGYSPIPSPIINANCLLISRMRAIRQLAEMPMSESYEEYSYALQAAAPEIRKIAILSPEIASVLARYREVVA